MLAAVLARINMMKLITLLNRPMADEKLKHLAFQADFVHIGGDDFGNIQSHVVLHQVNFLVTDVHHIAQCHNEQMTMVGMMVGMSMWRIR